VALPQFEKLARPFYFFFTGGSLHASQGVAHAFTCFINRVTLMANAMSDSDAVDVPK
jgi:hypothetical protein